MRRSDSRRSDRFDSFDTNMGNYSARKIPKFSFSNADVMEYLSTFDLMDEDLEMPKGFQLRQRPAT
ncbi:MAG: hypothetical protein K2X66_09310 [Cyanobacteria bacterium]|nr:hypothetical protein [Cyanobacteriota bacterium]